MTRCFLGRTKLNRISDILGKPVLSASVRGGNEHFWASVRTADGESLLVNYKTREVIKDSRILNETKQRYFDLAWEMGMDVVTAKQEADKIERDMIAAWTKEYVK
jgi:hypothetical protein